MYRVPGLVSQVRETLVIDWGVRQGLHVFCAVLAECFEVLGGVPKVVLATRRSARSGHGQRGDHRGRLVISPRTVATHVEHILTKHGFRSRTQIVTWFHDQDS